MTGKCDLRKLAPAPWESEPRGRSRAEDIHYVVTDAKGGVVFDTFNSDVALVECESGEEGTVYFEGVGSRHAAFAALARNAFDVMVRRGPSGWYASCDHLWGAPERRDKMAWCVRDREHQVVGPRGKELIWADDPFTVLIEADKWYREHVETQGKESER